MINVKLNNGIEMPIVGLGTFRSKEEDVYQAVLDAIEAGYRHIDTAMIYGNEEAIGKAIKDSKIPREELFITTKLWNSDQGYEKTKAAFELSLKNLDLEYIDLYLIHWFKGYELALDSYKAMEELYNEGKIKALGVSNFNVHHIMNLLENCTVKPTVNQVETHIALQNEFLQEYCESVGVKLEAYAPLMSQHISDLLSDETMNRIAKKYNKSVPQIAIKWLVTRGIIVIPKSIRKTRIIENFNIFDFELNSEDMADIKKLNKARKIFPEFDNVPF
jgi:diketogulonate reductase-like aldo/keto reductase